MDQHEEQMAQGVGSIMNIIVIAQVEEHQVQHISNELARQTIKPDKIAILVDKKPARGIDRRRKRITKNHSQLVDLVEMNKNIDLVWQVEGDCVLPDDCLERLLEDYDVLKGKDFGYISGVQVGRHGLYAIGAWHIPKDRKTFRSVDYRNKAGLYKVDATGFYCLLAPRDVWLSGKVSWNREPWGPDVNWGLSIDKDIYVDMSLEIGHKIKGGVIYPKHISTVNVDFYQKDGRWLYKTHE